MCWPHAHRPDETSSGCDAPAAARGDVLWGDERHVPGMYALDTAGKAATFMGRLVRRCLSGTLKLIVFFLNAERSMSQRGQSTDKLGICRTVRGNLA